MKLRSKLLMTTLGIASLILIIGIVGLFTSRRTIDAFNGIVDSTNPALTALGQAQVQANAMREAAVQSVMLARFRTISDGPLQFETAQSQLKIALHHYQTVDPETADLYPAVAAAETDLAATGITLMNSSNPDLDQTALLAQLSALDQAKADFDTAIGKIIDFETAELHEQLETANNSAQSAETIYILSMIVVVTVSVVLGILLAHDILRPLRSLQHITGEMVQGDYAQRTHITTRDEIGELAHAFDMMADAIQKRDADLNAANQTLEKRVEERTRELRIATREAQEASRLKDEFLSIMSHELRTPLNAIIGFQGILLMTGQFEERARHMLERAQANSNRLLALINDILDVSRIESGRYQLTKSDLAPSALVEKLQTQMSVLAEEKSLTFTVEIDPSVPATLYTDEDALTKIITNLLGNAFKFTDKGGVSLRMKSPADQLIIEVTDTGIGIPAHMQQVIFERFRQVDGSSKRLHGGSGLGLAIVQKLCLALEGTVQVQSVVGEGSTFTVVLPLEAEKVAL